MDLNFIDSPRQQWLFFDLDDTLWDFSANSVLALNFIYESFAIVSDTFSSPEDFIRIYHSQNAPLWQRFALGEVSAEFLKTERWRGTLFPATDPSVAPAICKTIDTAYLDCLANQAATTPGALQWLEDAKNKYLIAVLSNGFADTQYKKLYNSGLWRYVARLIVSDEIKINKPDSRLFKYAVDATGASGTPIMIGDSLANDVTGALKAGWKAVWYNPAGAELPQHLLSDAGVPLNNYLGSIKTISELTPLLENRKA